MKYLRGPFDGPLSPPQVEPPLQNHQACTKDVRDIRTSALTESPGCPSPRVLCNLTSVKLTFTVSCGPTAIPLAHRQLASLFPQALVDPSLPKAHRHFRGCRAQRRHHTGQKPNRSTAAEPGPLKPPHIFCQHAILSHHHLHHLPLRLHKLPARSSSHGLFALGFLRSGIRITL